MHIDELEALIKKVESGEATNEEKLELLKQIDDMDSILNALLDEVQAQKLREELEKEQ